MPKFGEGEQNSN